MKKNQGKKKTKIPTNDPNAKPLENLFLPLRKEIGGIIAPKKSHTEQRSCSNNDAVDKNKGM